MIDTITLKNKILDLAICGKLTVQNFETESAQDYFQELKLIKKDLLNSKKIKNEKIVETNDKFPFEIPDNWIWCSLAELCQSVTDGTHKTPTYIEKGVPFLSVKNISAGSFDMKDVKYISKQEHEELIKRCNPEMGDVLFCRIGTLGKAIEIDFEPSFSIFVSLGLIKPLEMNLSKYIVKVINSGYGNCWIKNNKAGDSMHAAKINLDVLRSFMIPLPPREEQERIVDRVDELFKLLDIVDKAQQKYFSDLEVLKSKIIDAGIQGKLTEQLPEDGTAEELLEQIAEEKKMNVKEGKIKASKSLPEITEDEIPFEIPDNWKWCRLVDLCKEITDGTHKTPTYIETGVPFLSVKNVSSGHFDFEDVKYISESEHRELIKRCNPEKGDILICRIGTLGKAIEIDINVDFSIFVSLGLIKPLDSYLSKYLVYVLNSGFGEKWIKKNKAGDAMHAAKINLDVLRSFLVPLPPLLEQTRIVDKIDEMLSIVQR